MTMRVGYIGLGQMGSGIAANLVKAGHSVTVFNRTKAKTANLVALGAKAADSAGEACEGDAVFTMLADDAALEAVAFAKDGIVARLRPGAVHVSQSTISVALAERLSDAHQKAGQEFVSAPVFGRPDAAAAAKLFVVACGAPKALETVEPLLAAIGQKTFVMGDRPASANLVKLSGNFLIASVIECLGEAIALVDKGGIDRKAYVELLTGSLFNARVYQSYGGMIAERRFEPAGFAAMLGRKDIRLALAAAEGLNVPMPVASLLRDRFTALIAQGGADLDWSAITRLAAQEAGLE